MLFNNLDYADDFLSIVNRFEGNQTGHCPAGHSQPGYIKSFRKDIIICQPQSGWIPSNCTKLFKFRTCPGSCAVCIKADAFLDILTTICGAMGGLLSNFLSTMEFRDWPNLRQNMQRNIGLCLIKIENELLRLLQ